MKLAGEDMGALSVGLASTAGVGFSKTPIGSMGACLSSGLGGGNCTELSNLLSGSFTGGPVVLEPCEAARFTEVVDLVESLVVFDRGTVCLRLRSTT